MTTTDRTAINTANAQHSTGPRTGEGKARSSRNAVKHGLTSRHILIEPGEEDEFAELRDTLLDELAPEGALEAVFFEQIIHAAWNIRRFRALETQLMAYGIESVLDEKYAKALDRLTRYATSAQRSYIRALKELRTLQKNRAVSRTVPELVSTPKKTKRTHQPPPDDRSMLRSLLGRVDDAIARSLQNEPDDLPSLRDA